MQTEEGFYQAATYITEEEAYREEQNETAATDYRRRMPSRNNLHYQLLNESPLINHRTRLEWMSELYMVHSHSIVFNNVRRDMVSGLTDSGLLFDSNFEGANLDLVVKVNHKEFLLYMRPDTNTLGHFQWFNFKVRCFKRNKIVHFHINNFNKSDLLYDQGLRPYAHSNRSSSENWEQLKSDSTTFQENPDGTGRLTFSYSFLHDYEEVEFAAQPPYTYQRLRKLLLEMDLSNGMLCQSLLKLKIPKIMLGCRDPSKLDAVGLVVGRQHPGEPVGSWMTEGFLREVTAKAGTCKILWVIVPMLNVDGVVLGNNRTGLVGYDLNRLYNQQQTKAKTKSQHIVEIKYLLEVVRRLKKKYGRLFQLFLDFHGHSAKKNVFSYGPPYSRTSDEYVQACLLPKLIADGTNLFRADESSYTVPRSKLNTARAVLFNKYNVPFCYTIEASYGLADGGVRLKDADYVEVGRKVAQASEKFCQYLSQKHRNLNDEPSSTTSNQGHLQQLIEQIKQNIQKEVEVEADQGDSLDEEDSSYDGSQQDLHQAQRMKLEENIAKVIKKQARKASESQTKDQNVSSLKRTNPTTIDHVSSRDIQRQEPQSREAKTFVPRIALRKEFRFRRLNETRNRLFNLYSYQPQIRQQYALHVANTINEQPDTVNIRTQKNSLQSRQNQTLKNLPPLMKVPEKKQDQDNRRLVAMSQRRLQTEHYNKSERDNQQRRKKMSAHLLTEETEEGYGSPLRRRYALDSRKEKQSYIREVLKNKKNKIGSRLLIINEM